MLASPGGSRLSAARGLAAAALASLVVLTGCLGGGDDDGAGAGPAPRLSASQPCREAHGFTCSTLVVPLDHARPGGATLRLQVGSAGDADAPVLLALAGGPGQPGVALGDRTVRRLGPAARDYRLVMYDQRGTGDGALRCPALQRAMGSSDLYPPPAPAVRECARALGPARRLFGTDDVVEDMEALRRALGVDKWTLSGVSYGTFVAARYALAHPEHVQALVLDSVVPHAGREDLAVAGMSETPRVLRLACASRRCPGDPVADLRAVVRRTGRGPQLLDALTFTSIIDPTYRRIDVPSILHDARLGDTARLDRFLGTVRRFSAAGAEFLSQGLHASSLCADWRFPWGDSEAPLAGREDAVRAHARRLSPRQLGPFDRATATGNGFIRQCLYWPPTPATPAPRPGTRLPAVPTLLLSGDRDLSTPLKWAREEAALAPEGRLVVIRGAGHSVERTPAGRRAIRAFLQR
jgi:pimeloyl-ACP methyl ester carboxylesterase